ncbi:hypothetical protein vBAspPH44_31 [Alteromonas phage vB_AspP-H4/4]|uniref:Uncharacterized protein n=1 Tax=Alteromonas phage vB_AspP-H4/4 TaxID=2928692 RepID=A0A220YL99_9CAUD|nr:hypothetical protein HOR85_gp31 [Alteromonas phage vB_AspP-H4/4]ASL24414.1 hypothetical protein vBAspPH44_31 [Alteromonas phage vB_AspP-H4/4]
MSFIATAIVATAGATLYSSKRQRDAQKAANKQAKIDANEAEAQARTAEVFAETEGEGLGNLGQVSLEVDDDLEEDEDVSTNVSI